MRLSTSWARVTAAVSLAAAGIAACTSVGAPPRHPASADLAAGTALAAPADLRIFATGDTHGFLEPCGCESGQFGGIARRVTYLRAAARDADLRIDLGNLSAGQGEIRRLRVEGALEALALARCDALVPGRSELLAGPAFEAAARARGIRVVCANVSDDQGRAVFEPAYVHTGPGGLRVGVVGLAEAPDEAVPGRWVTRPDEALRAQLAALRGKVDVVVAATSLAEPEARALARRFPDLALVLSGRAAESGAEFDRRSDPPVAFAGDRAEYVLTIDVDARLGVTAWRRSWLDEAVPAAPEAQAIVRRHRDAVAALDAEYVEKLVEARRAEGYAGSAACAACHRDEHETWRTSLHAVAMDALKRRGAHRDPECVPCHLVDVPPPPTAAAPGAHAAAVAAPAGLPYDPDAMGVGCEACHGGSAAHAAQPSVRTPVADGGRRGCGPRCHHPPEVRGFSFDEQWPRIRHGGR